MDGQTKTDQLVPRHVIRQRNEKPSAQDVIVPLAQQLIVAGEKIIVFRNMRGKAQGCAAYLAHDLGLPPASDALAQLPNGDNSAASAKLRECLNGGTAFHTSNLAREEREIIERSFRQADGAIKALGATTTVAAGINTPADTVIKVYTPLFNKGKGKEAEWPSRLSRLPGAPLFHMMQSFANDDAAYIRRCKRICILSDWINGVSSEIIEKTYTINQYFGSVNYGDIRGIADTTRFLMRSARKIVSLLLAASPELEEQIEILLQQLEVGVPEPSRH